MRTPLAQNVSFTSLPRSYATVCLVRGLLSYGVLSIIAAISAGLMAPNMTLGWLLWVGVLILVVAGVWDTYIDVRRAHIFGYAELDAELLIRSGVMFHRVSVVPYGRMQKVDVHTGPLLKIFGLANVHLLTAATTTEAKIYGVTVAEAERLRVKLTHLGQAHMEGL
ncbi:PH domain-containing protein [Trueperella sp. LYQ143]|uniref:PH domain-containing protein n=1 Tax=unclassified Trueperella TaxID=2630174 RepID=UPI003983D8FB